MRGQLHVPVAASQGESHSLYMQQGGHQNQSGHFRAEISPAPVTNLAILPQSTSLWPSHYMDYISPIPIWNAVSNILIIIHENVKLSRKKNTPYVKYAEHVTTGRKFNTYKCLR